MKKFLKKFMRDSSGLTYLEYALLAALIIVIAIAVITNLGTNLQGTMQTVVTATT